MKKIAVLAALGLLCAPALAVNEAPAMDIAKKSGCLICHGLDNKIVGPALKDIGKKYVGVPAAEAELIAKVTKGSTGVWGQIPMPPNTVAKGDDIKTLVQFILTLK